MKTLFALILTIPFAISATAKKEEITLAKIKMFNDLIEIKVPTTFTVMHDFEVKKVYPENDLPKVVYANADKTIRIAFRNKKSGEQTKPAVFKDSFYADWQKADPKLKELSNGLATVDGRDMAFVGVLHKTPEKEFQFLFCTIYKGMFMSGEIISPKKGYKPWIDLGNQIMNSLHINEK